jgi:hypothetical protein
VEARIDDVCSFGHQLVPGSDPIRIVELDEAGRKVSEQTLLLRRHSPYGLAHTVSVTHPTKLVAYPCDHALPESAVAPEDVPFWMFKGQSYGRGHWLTYTPKKVGIVTVILAQCPVCLGQPAPDWAN